MGYSNRHLLFKSKKVKSFGIPALILALMSVGAGPCSREFPVGFYKGNMILQKDSGELQASRVQIKAAYHHKGNATLIFRDLLTKEEVMPPLVVTHFKGKKSFDLMIPTLNREQFHLEKVDSSGVFGSGILGNRCYAGDSVKKSPKNSFHVSACLSLSRFELRVTTDSGIPVLQIQGKTYDPNRGGLLDERPREFTSGDLIRLALRRQSDSVDAYHTLLEGHSGPNALIPVSFPRRWIKDEHRNWQTQASQMTQKIVQSQTITAVQGLVLRYQAEKNYLKGLEDALKGSDEVLKKLTLLEDQARVPQGSVSLIQEVLKTWKEEDPLQSEERVQSILSSLADQIGANNPDIISKLTLSDETQIEDRVSLASPNLIETAILQSPELYQQALLRRAVESKESHVIDDWFIPSGGSPYAPGFYFDLDEQRALGASEVISSQMKTVESKIQTQVQHWIQNRKIKSQEAALMNERRLSKQTCIAEQFSSIMAARLEGPRRSDFSPGKLKSDLKSFRKALRAEIDARTAVMIDQVHLDRIQFQGLHQQFRFL